MLYTLLTIYITLLKIAVPVGVLLVLVSGGDWVLRFFRQGRREALSRKQRKALRFKQQQHRMTKETSAHAGMYKRSRVQEIDATGKRISRTVLVPTKKGVEYNRAMDRLFDEQIFQNTKDL